MKYIDVYNDIKRKIEDKVYHPWTTLQGEEFLCEMYGISRTTIRKAISKLRQEGYIHSRQGSGIFVNPPEFYEEKNLKTLSERMEKKQNIENNILKFKIIKAGKKLADLFNIAIESELYYYKRLRSIEDEPKVLEETYMPKYLFKDFSEEKAKSSVLKYIEKDCKHVISHDVKNITAINITKELSDLLQIKEGIATLQIEHKVYLIKSVLAQYTKEIQVKNNIKFVSVR
ncbi:GntR family transcriptional regulator [Clostridium oceanicum]|uniref:UTRA domain-containing protein n=1 Tax=Clostridium oceanicum TaxID=1543 RepID=A0ABP3UN74_9CLOT